MNPDLQRRLAWLRLAAFFCLLSVVLAHVWRVNRDSLAYFFKVPRWGAEDYLTLAGGVAFVVIIAACAAIAVVASRKDS